MKTPMQAHAAMEPLCATASVTPERCEVWAPTQSSDFAMMMAMGVTKTVLRRKSRCTRPTSEVGLDEK